MEREKKERRRERIKEMKGGKIEETEAVLTKWCLYWWALPGEVWQAHRGCQTCA